MKHMLRLRSDAWINDHKSVGYHATSARLTQLQAAKKQKGSVKRTRARIKVVKLHACIADTRSHFLHQLSNRIVRENQVIAVENLAVSNMKENRSLSQSISDAGWGGSCANWNIRRLGTVAL